MSPASSSQESQGCRLARQLRPTGSSRSWSGTSSSVAPNAGEPPPAPGRPRNRPHRPAGRGVEHARSSQEGVARSASQAARLSTQSAIHGVGCVNRPVPIMAIRTILRPTSAAKEVVVAFPRAAGTGILVLIVMRVSPVTPDGQHTCSVRGRSPAKQESSATRSQNEAVEPLKAPATGESDPLRALGRSAPGRFVMAKTYLSVRGRKDRGWSELGVRGRTSRQSDHNKGVRSPSDTKP